MHNKLFLYLFYFIHIVCILFFGMHTPFSFLLSYIYINIFGCIGCNQWWNCTKKLSRTGSIPPLVVAQKTQWCRFNRNWLGYICRIYILVILGLFNIRPHFRCMGKNYQIFQVCGEGKVGLFFILFNLENCWYMLNKKVLFYVLPYCSQ